MTAALLDAIADVATLILLAATAVFGFIQLRHMRATNELAALLAIERDFRTPGVQHALRYVARELAARLDDAAYRARLAQPGYIDPAQHPEMVLCNWFNRSGALVRRGYVDEDVFLRSFGRLVTYYWERLGPVVAILRRARGPGEYAGFEYLAYRANLQRRIPRRRRPIAAPSVRVVDAWSTEDARRGAAP